MRSLPLLLGLTRPRMFLCYRCGKYHFRRLLTPFFLGHHGEISQLSNLLFPLSFPP